MNLFALHACLAELDIWLSKASATRSQELQTPRKLIEEIDSQPPPPPRPKASEKPLKFTVKLPTSVSKFSRRGVSGLQKIVFKLVAHLSSLSYEVLIMSIYFQSGRSSPAAPLSSDTGSGSTTPSVETTQLTSLPGHSPSIQSKALTSTVPTSSSSQPITVQIQHTENGPRFMIPSGTFSNS